MLRNLKAEMARQGLSNKDVAKAIGISDRALGNKINGASEPTRREMIDIKRILFNHLSIVYLFELDEGNRIGNLFTDKGKIGCRK
ncbi:MAG: helix-turn-helix domain-containing protein [Peptococcaceae bacterium]|nr:helix-turn-helix domain-containing protein [Peptococcaceae bacterium]